MRISFRIILINFVIVVLVLGSAAFAFYSAMYKVLTSQQSRHLLSSANSFIYAYRTKLIETEDEFMSVFANDLGIVLNKKKLEAENIDFILERETSDPNTVLRYACSERIHLPASNFNLNEFLEFNPYVIVATYNGGNSKD